VGPLSPRTAQAVEDATTNGARVIEAYPNDTAAAKKSVNQLFRAVLSVFEAAGSARPCDRSPTGRSWHSRSAGRAQRVRAGSTVSPRLARIPM